MSGLACSIKRRIADTETFDAEVIPDKKLDKKICSSTDHVKIPLSIQKCNYS